MADAETTLDKIFSAKNRALSDQIVKLLSDETGMNIFAVLAFVSTYAVISASEKTTGNRTDVRDMYVGLIDTFLKASGDANAERDTTPPQFFN